MLWLIWNYTSYNTKYIYCKLGMHFVTKKKANANHSFHCITKICYVKTIREKFGTKELRKHLKVYES